MVVHGEGTVSAPTSSLACNLAHCRAFMVAHSEGIISVGVSIGSLLSRSTRSSYRHKETGEAALVCKFDAASYAMSRPVEAWED